MGQENPSSYWHDKNFIFFVRVLNIFIIISSNSLSDVLSAGLTQRQFFKHFLKLCQSAYCLDVMDTRCRVKYMFNMLLPGTISKWNTPSTDSKMTHISKNFTIFSVFL